MENDIVTGAVSYTISLLVGGGLVALLFKRVANDLERRLKEMSDTMKAIRQNADEIDREAMQRSASMDARLTALMLELPRDYVRMHQHNDTISELRSNDRIVEQKMENRFDKVDRRFDELISILKTK